MVKIKPLDRISKNFEAAIPEAQRRYREEVASTSGVIEAAIKAQDKYVAAVTNPENQERRVKNLRKVSDEEWRRAASGQGANRIAEGMRAGVAAQRKGYQPYHDAMSALALPESTTDGLQNLISRGGAVVKAMMDKKKEVG